MRINSFVGMALAVVSLTACSVEEGEDTNAKMKEEYTQAFVNEFGSINANQDWNVVEQKTVTVKTATPSTVKVYEKQGGKYRLAADYAGVQGSKTITFDGLEGDDTPFIVSINGCDLAVANGQTIDCTKAVNGVKRSSKVPEDWRQYITYGSTKDNVTLSTDDDVICALIKEGRDNSEIVGVEDPFKKTLSPNEAATFYPMYWNSDHPGEYTLGIYYYDTDLERHEVDMYTNDEDDVPYSEGSEFQSYPLTITPPETIVCGVYVRIGERTYYSDPALNVDKASFFGYRTVGTTDPYTYLCFDAPDDYILEGDHDFNDLVFLLPGKTTPISSDPVSWMVACEDLGGTFDYDFNDVVFRVSHVAGQDYADIYPMAAGGSLPTYLFYNNTQISEDWHQHFGSDGYEYNKLVNTGHGGAKMEQEIWPIQITGLPEDWSMKSFTAEEDSKHGNIHIVVTRADKQTISITGPSKGEAPQMLVLPYEWQWPTELTRITTAYPGFGQWGENYANSSWVNTAVSGKVMTLSEDDMKITKSPKVVNVSD